MTIIRFPQKRTFEKWLRSLPENTAVAERWTGSTCPLCVFLNETGRAKRPYVSPKWGKDTSAFWQDYAHETGPLPLPEWADAFSRGIDKLARLHFIGKGETFYRAVDPSDCLAVLADI